MTQPLGCVLYIDHISHEHQLFDKHFIAFCKLLEYLNHIQLSLEKDYHGSCLVIVYIY